METRLRILPPLLWVLAVALTLAAPRSLAASPASGPTLAVVGFGFANLTPSKTSPPPQIELNLEASAATASAALKALDTDVTAVEKALEAAGVAKAAITPQGPPGLNFVSPASEANCEKVYKLKGVPANCPSPGFQATEELQVTFQNLTDLATALTKSGVEKASGVQNFWINQGGSGSAAASPAALAAAYRQAFQDAERTARLIAGADHLVLGTVISVTEGAILSTPCGGMGCGPIPVQGVNPPAVGPNQELVAITVTYRTAR